MSIAKMNEYCINIYSPGSQATDWGPKLPLRIILGLRYRVHPRPRLSIISTYYQLYCDVDIFRWGSTPNADILACNFWSHST